MAFLLLRAGTLTIRSAPLRLVRRRVLSRCRGRSSTGPLRPKCRAPSSRTWPWAPPVGPGARTLGWLRPSSRRSTSADVIWLWPLLVVAAFRSRCPRLRREWRPTYEGRRGRRSAGRGRSRRVVCFFTAYLTDGLPRSQPDPAHSRADGLLILDLIPTSSRWPARRGPCLSAGGAAGRGRAALLPLVRLRPHGHDVDGWLHRPAGGVAAAGHPGLVRARHPCSPAPSSGGGSVTGP